MKFLLPLLILPLLLASHMFVETSPVVPSPAEQKLALLAEKHLGNMRQLTFGGENAEAYFSADGRKLIFQSKRDGRECDRIYTMNADGSDVSMASTGNWHGAGAHYL